MLEGDLPWADPVDNLHSVVTLDERTPLVSRFRFSAIALAAVTLLAACGSSPRDAASTTASGGPVGSVVDADVEFAQGMIAHHEQAVEMAAIALDPERQAGADVLDLAARIQAAQEPEIEQMAAWLTAAGQPVTMDTSHGHDMSSMDGMMSPDQMVVLAAATGAEFDTMWLEMMVVHHEGAITQSQSVKVNGSDPELRALADQIIAVQEAEIAEIRALLAD